VHDIPDPTRGDDPRFDPADAQAQAVLARATAGEGSSRRAAARPRVRRRLTLAGGLGVACALAAVVALGAGSGTGGLGPADALAQAAEKTAAVTSGVARTLIVAPDGAQVETVIRFDGEDAEATVNQRDAGGTTDELARRVVDGVRYERGQDGSWNVVKGDGSHDADSVRAEIGNRALYDLVRAATDVTRDGDVYKAQVPAKALRGLENVPLGLGEVAPAEEVPVEITAANGLITSVSIDSQLGRYTVAYSKLGEPQSIAAPETDPEG
jgi:hypothetical protein